MTAESGNEAVANGRQHDSYDSGMCQKFVRGPCWEVGSLYGSAIEAWNGATEKHPGDRTPPVGAPVYYKGGQYGHAVIYVGNGRIRSTDCPSKGLVSDTDLDWPTRQWGYSYLGWTGDINGVDLPIGDDMALSDSDLDKIRKIVSEEVAERVGDVVPWPTADNEDNTIFAKTALAQIKDVQSYSKQALDILKGS